MNDAAVVTALVGGETVFASRSTIDRRPPSLRAKAVAKPTSPPPATTTSCVAGITQPLAEKLM